MALLNVHKIQAGDIAANAVTTAALAAGAVNADKLAANSVNASKIVTGAITADKLAANSVTAVKIAAGIHHVRQNRGGPVPRLRVHRRRLPKLQGREHRHEAQLDRIANVGFGS